MCSEYTEVNGDAVEMAPEGAGYGWTVYEISTEGYPGISLTLDVEVASGEVYFGLSDFERGAWSFRDPVNMTAAHELPLESKNIDIEDFVYLVVVTTPDGWVTLHNVVATVDAPGWYIYTLDNSAGAGWNVDMFVLGSKPMLAWANNLNGDIRFLRAETSFPTSPGQWVSMEADSDPAPALLGAPLAAASIDGAPAIAYVEREEDLIKYAYSTVPEPSSINDWVSQEVHDAVAAGYQLGLTELDGRPGLVFGHDYGDVRFAQAPTSHPQSIEWVVTEVIPAGYEASWVSLGTANGRPSIFCSGRFEGGWAAHYLRGKVAFPGGPDDWMHYPAYSLSTAGGTNSLAIVPVKPDTYRPVVSFLGNYFKGLLVVAVGETAVPTFDSDWAFTYFDNDVTYADLTSCADYPFVIYTCEDEAAVKCAWAQELVPAGDWDWLYSTLETGIDAGSVSTVSIGGTPVIAYRDNSNNVLKFGFYDE